MNTISNILPAFRPISLGEMDNVQFMNRTDTKYVFAASMLPELLNRSQKQYQVLEIEGQRDMGYHTTYLDTCDFVLFNVHLKGQLERYKVRYRIYQNSGTSYLEVKCKTNKERTIKKRIKNRLEKGSDQEQALDFLKGFFPEEYLGLGPVLVNTFKRITLVGTEPPERITIDHDLEFSDLEGKKVAMPYLAIAELKRDGFSSRSPFIQILKELNIRQSGFSKYCVGNGLLYDHERKNMLKPKFRLINKIKQEYDIASTR